MKQLSRIGRLTDQPRPRNTAPEFEVVILW
jgi:hypothetical protein